VALATLLVLALATPHGANADELADLRRENARLKAEVQSLKAQLESAHGNAQAGGGATGSAGSAAGTRMEPIFIPRSRVSLEVGRDEATGKTTLATLWYRTADVGPLPRKEWLQLRAQQDPTGDLDGTWLLIERQGGGGGAKVSAGSLTVDGSVIELPVTDYDAKRKNQTIGPTSSTTRDERIRFAVPVRALPLVANARTARFEAGAISFDLTDEHMAAFAAMAARLAAAAPAAAAPKN
jgi:hypothetical protein